MRPADMNEMHAQSPDRDDVFLNLVGFKWLMLGLGWRVELSRFWHDAAYASECVRRGLSSDCGPLRRRSAELLPFLPSSGMQCSAAMPFASPHREPGVAADMATG